MKTLKRIRYHTANSWNLSTAPAYNLKIYNVINNELQDKVYKLMDSPDFYDGINLLMQDFDIEHGYKWQVGFNGRSGGYLVLYKGGRNEDGRPFSYPGKQIEDDGVPVDVLKAFRRLALDIVKTTEDMAKNCQVVDEDYTVTRTRKTIVQVKID